MDIPAPAQQSFDIDTCLPNPVMSAQIPLYTNTVSSQRCILHDGLEEAGRQAEVPRDIGAAHGGRNEPTGGEGGDLDTALEVAELAATEWGVVATVAKVAAIVGGVD